MYFRTETSSRPEVWASVHAALSAPFLIMRPARRYLGQAGGESVRIACVGREARFRRLLKESGGAEPVGVDRRRSLWAPSALARLDADLVAVEIHRWAAESFRREGWSILPQTVRWCAAAVDVPPPRPSRSLKSDLRLIAARGYSLEIRRDGAAWREFLCRMVVPFLQRRFGQRTLHASPALVRKVAADGEILFVVENGQRLAGVAVLVSGTRLWVPLLGVWDGDVELVRRGVIAAAYRFVIERAHETGMRTLDLGRTTPYLDQGLAWYKAKWGFTPQRDVMAPLVAIRVDPSHQGLQDLLRNHPLLVDTGEHLVRFPEDA